MRLLITMLPFRDGRPEKDILHGRLNEYATALVTAVAAKEGTLRTCICLEHEQRAEFSYVDGTTLPNLSTQMMPNNLPTSGNVSLTESDRLA